jgi:hypothetical protein
MIKCLFLILSLSLNCFALQQQKHILIQNIGMEKIDPGPFDKDWLQIWNLECFDTNLKNICYISVIGTNPQLLSQSNTNRNQDEITDFKTVTFKDKKNKIFTRATFTYSPSWRLDRKINCNILLKGNPDDRANQVLEEFECLTPEFKKSGYRAIKEEKLLNIKIRSINSMSLNQKSHSIINVNK